MAQPVAPPHAPAPRLSWVRSADRTPSRKLADKLLDAAQGLLATRDWDEIPVSDVARAAGTTPAALLARFPNKAALLAALHERFVNDTRATADEVLDPDLWAGAEISAIVEALVELQIRIYTEQAGLLRAFTLASIVDPGYRRRSEAVQQRMYQGYLELLLLHRNQLLHPEPTMAADFCTRIVSSMLTTGVLFPNHSGPTRMTQDQIRSELTYTCLSYLGVFPDHALDG